MNLPTDTEIEKRAMEIAQKDFDDNGSSEALAGMYAATLEALKIDRESYALLMGLNHFGNCHIHMMARLFDRLPHDSPSNCTCGKEHHLTTLRTRLGITE